MHEFLRQIVIGSLIIMLSAQQVFNLMFMQYIVCFFIFALASSGIFMILMKLNKLDSERKSFIKYYKVKIASTMLWILEICIFLVIRIVLKINYASLIFDHILISIGLGIDLLLICCLRKIYKVVLNGGPLKSANVGVEIKIENAEPGNSSTSELVFEATVITEISSFPAKNLIENQCIEPNSTIIVNDYTKDDNTVKENVDIEEIRLD